MTYTRSTLAAMDAAAIADAYNRVYEDYVVPFVVTADWADQHVRRHHVALEHSPLWLDHAGNIAAMAALGVRGSRGWVGGFGIARTHRGQGLGNELIAEVLATARSLGLSRVGLEVITSNEAAIRTYRRVGFVHQRDLLVLSRQPGALTVDVDTSAVCDLQASVALAMRSMVEPKPDWSREPVSLASLEDLQALALGSEDAPTAVALYRVVNDVVRLYDVAAIDTDSAIALAAGMIERWSDVTLTLVNEPEASVMLPVLLDAGWNEALRQHELVWHAND